jgi:hypothetical protein
MVYLEKEVRELNGEIDEFLYSHEYIDSYGQGIDEEVDMRIELLLGVQDWRRGWFSDVNKFKKKILDMDNDDHEKLRLEYLYGRKVLPQYVHYPRRMEKNYRGGGIRPLAIEEDGMIPYDAEMGNDIAYDSPLP